MVESLYFVPSWFFDIDIVLGVIFALITGIVAAYSVKLSMLTEERQFKLFSIAFTCISASYVLRLVLNLFLTKVLATQPGVLWIADFNLFSKTIIYLYILLFIVGYVTLAYTTFRVRNLSVYVLLILLSMTAIFFSLNKSLTVYLISSLFLAFICYHYIRRCFNTPSRKKVLIIAAFLLLLASNVSFMFITDYSFYQGYILSESLELVAYLVIAFTLASIVYHGKKTG